jgi:hypothetical protein
MSLSSTWKPQSHFDIDLRRRYYPSSTWKPQSQLEIDNRRRYYPIASASSAKRAREQAIQICESS